MNGFDMELWKEEICKVGRRLERAQGMVRYHQGELRHCASEEEEEIRNVIGGWAEQKSQAEVELDTMIDQLIVFARKSEKMPMTRRDRYFQDLWIDVIEICGEDSLTANYLREIIEFWKDKPLEPPPEASFLHVRVVGLRNEMLRMQGKQPWDWRKEK